MSVTLDEKQGEVYARLTGFLMPPHPMTEDEWGEWFTRERLPVIQASGVTLDDVANGIHLLAKAANQSGI